MEPSKTPHIWSAEALYFKAERYAEEMHSKEQSDWQFGFWSTFTLEMLLRACVAKISPSLLADARDWSNSLFAVGIVPNVKRFVPKSADLSTLLPLIQNTFPDFTPEMLDFCVAHIAKRNSEVHSGELAFDGLGTSSWLPNFYLTCECLLALVGGSLESFLGEDEIVEAARTHIQAAKDKAAQAVKQSINAHKTIWEDKSEQERDDLSNQSKAVMTRYYGHRVKCPSCQSDAILHGAAAGPVTRQINDDSITERQPMLPSSFECAACGLRISGYSKLVACGLGDVFISSSSYKPVEFFNIDIEDEYRSLMGEDNNEPY